MVGDRWPQRTLNCYTITPAMTTIARYSLLTMRPDPERIDVLCIGALVLTPDGAWQVLTPGKEKLESIGHIGASRRLMAMAVNLRELLADCEKLADARAMLERMQSTLRLHEFEGVFSFDSIVDFQRQVDAISQESIIVQKHADETQIRQKPAKPRVRAKLRRHFSEMGVLAATGDMNADHKVVPNYPIEPKHGLKAEFALKNSVWHITETVDFDVAAEGVRNKIFEAQAKCLVMRAAKDIFGPKTKRYIVVHGSDADHASSSIDLLSTVGELFMTESNEDMTNYLNLIAKAAGGTYQIGSSS